MVTTLYLIRHGKTDGGDTKRYHGRIDVPLSPQGADQIRTASSFVLSRLQDPAGSKHTSYLRDIHGETGRQGPGAADTKQGLSAVYTSDLSRAKASAELIAEPHGRKPVIVPALRERSFGIWEGMTFTEIIDRYPAEFQAWASDPLRFSPLGGESTREVCDRVIPALDAIVGRHAGEDIAIVAHGGVNRVILSHVLGMPLENIFRIEQEHAAVNIIEFWDRYPVVKLLNGGPQGS